MIGFENPAAFLFLLLLPLKLLLEKKGILKKATFPLTLSDWNGKDFQWQVKVRKFAQGLAALCFALFYVLVVIALAEPVVHEQEKIYTSKGTEILLVLDTSPSMQARDIAGTTRLEAAKNGIRTLVEANKGATFGLVAMATEAASVVPPTSDHELFLKRLDTLAPGGLGSGSAIGIGISTAVYHLSSSNAPKKAIILITDGENNAGSVHPQTAARLAKDNDISLYVFGIGSKGSAPIEYYDSDTGKVHSGFYESDFNAAALEDMAVSAGGKFYAVEDTAVLLQDLQQISEKESVVQSYRLKNNDEYYYDKFLFAAIILFIAGWMLRRFFLQEVL